MTIRSFRDPDVWTLNKEIMLDVYRITRGSHEERPMVLVAQMRKAAVFPPSNVAEGFNRVHNKRYRQFLYAFLGACAELETQVEISAELGYATRKNPNA